MYFVYGLYFIYLQGRGLTQDNLTWLDANNKDADQPAHSHSLTSAFVICYLENIRVNLKKAKFQYSNLN